MRSAEGKLLLWLDSLPSLPRADGIVAIFELCPGNTLSLQALFLDVKHDS